MSATVIYIAQWKTDHASLQIRFEPLVAWCAWLDWLAGSRRTEAVSGVVRAIGVR